jgi:hypothetical protein
MARCKYLGCRIAIERVPADMTVATLSGLAPDDAPWRAIGGAGADTCPGGGSNGRHQPARPVTVERHPGEAGNGDVEWCEYPPGEDHFAGYLVAGKHAVCDEHIAYAVDVTLMEH